MESRYCMSSYNRCYMVPSRQPYSFGRTSPNSLLRSWDSPLTHTIIWHVDDLKLSHVKQSVLDDIADELNLKYGQVALLVVNHGKIHDYLGMTIDYSKDSKVKFMMCDYIQGILDGAPAEMVGFTITPAASNLFTVRKDANKLDDKCSEVCHHITAQLLNLCKWARPDLQPTIAFLTTRVTQLDVDNWKKLTCCVQNLHNLKELTLPWRLMMELTLNGGLMHCLQYTWTRRAIQGQLCHLGRIWCTPSCQGSNGSTPKAWLRLK